MMENVLSLVDLALEEQESHGFIHDIISGNSSNSVNCGSAESIGC